MTAPFRRPPNALKAAAHDGPRPYAGGVSIAAPQRRPARRPGGPGPRLGVRVTRGGPQAHKRKALGADSTDSSRGPAERSARGTGRLRPNGPPAGGAKPGGPFGAEGAQHGHHPMGPLCAPEHLRGERPGRSRAGQKARPRSARRAWPCLLIGRRKRPHRCPAGACGSMKRGRGPAGRRTAAGGERPRRRLRPPERGGRTPAWWPALPILSSAPRRGTQGGRGFRGRGAPEAQGAPSWEQLSGSSAAR